MAKKKGGKRTAERAKSKAAPSTARPDAGSAPPAPDATDANEPADAAGEEVEVRARDSAPGAAAEGADAPATPSPSQAPPTKKSAAPPADGPPRGAPWGAPLAKIDHAFTWFEVRLLIVIVLALVVSLVAWVGLRAMSSPIESEDRAGGVFRMFFGATVLGFVAYFGLARVKLPDRTKNLAVAVAIGVGGALAPLWRETGIEPAGHLLNWLQEGSGLTMFGGLRGMSTRLTVLLAFIGGSLAAASGKHINIDLALRFVSPKLKLPVFVLQSLATVAFCVVAAWSFFQYIAITNFNLDRDMAGGEMVSRVNANIGQDMFLLRRQLSFDLSTLPHVLGGGRWDDEGRMNGRQWNELVERSGYRDYFTAEQVEAIKSPASAADDSRLMLAIGPDGQPRNQLVRTMNLTFAVGFLFMAFRFLLRLGLVLSGHASLEGEHDSNPDDDPVRHHEREEIAEAAEAMAGGDPPAKGEGADADDAAADDDAADERTGKGGA